MNAAVTQDGNGSTRVLAMAMELSASKWKLLFTVGVGQRPRERTIAAGARELLVQEIERAKQRFGLPGDAPVISCYEAGRDGFWIHRALEEIAVRNVVVDSSSIEMPRRSKRAKTDRLDARKLLAMLLRYASGERDVWRVVRVPSETDEDARHQHRAREALKNERTRLVNRMQGLLSCQGVLRRPTDLAHAAFEPLRRWNGQSLPPGVLARLRIEQERLRLVERQLREVDLDRARRSSANKAEAKTRAQEQIAKLIKLNGIGPVGAWVPVHEVFAWREIRNRRQLGALMGLAPMPWMSGSIVQDQGISKAGSARLRALAVELAWGWLRYQPRSELTLWYQKRFANGSSRLRRIGIVALARKLMIALWRYLENDELPAGAILKV